MYASLLKEGHRYGGGLAPKTVRNLHIALRRSLADAHRLGLVRRNVAAVVKPPAPVRHEITTWATLALQAGIHPKVVSERLGHATTGITLDIYSHVQPEFDAHAATAVAELFGDTNKGTKAARRG